MFEAVSKQSLSDVVFDQLRDRIVREDLNAGDELPSERILCEMLDVNRGAVREAIKRLQQAGLVRVRHGGATTVLNYRTASGLELLPHLLVDKHGELQLDTARSIVRMRQILTPEIARDAALKQNPDALHRLRELTDKLRSESDTAHLQRSAFEFWEALVDASDNIAYRLALNSLRKTYEPLWELFTHMLEDDFHDLDSYLQLYQAVSDGDAEQAQTVAKQHIDHSSELINAFIDQFEASRNAAQQHNVETQP